MTGSTWKKLDLAFGVPIDFAWSVFQNEELPRACYVYTSQDIDANQAVNCRL